jgi:hypothetical protein
MWTDTGLDDNGKGHHRVLENPASGTLAINGHSSSTTAPVPRELFKVDPSVSNDQLRARLAYTLRQAGALKSELEKRTGLKLNISRDLRVIVDLE